MREALRDVDPPIDLQVAMDADQALAILNRDKEEGTTLPALIFLDFNLPKAGSRDLLRRIKADAQWCLIPVAVLTTSEAERDVRDAYELHANCYLRKPVDLDDFFDTIRVSANFWLKVAYTIGNGSERE